MSLIESLLLLLLLSRVLGELVERFGQPAMLGEIAAGILLGPSCLAFIRFNPEIKAIANIGVLLLVFLAGMEMDLGTLWKALRGRGVFVSISGFLAPLAGGMLVAHMFGLDRTRTVFIGLCIAITALPVSVRILMDLGKLHSEVAQKIISAAIANDVVSLLALGIILDLRSAPPNTASLVLSIGRSLGKAMVFMIVFGGAARLIRRFGPVRLLRSSSLFETMLSKVRGNESRFAAVLLFVIAFASFSEFLGLDFVVGAFFGSVLITNEAIGQENFRKIEETASSVTMGFLGPIFFASIGLQFNARTLRNWPLTVAILAMSFAGKIFGGYLGGRLARLSSAESWAVGMGLNGRGVMELVIASVALANGFIGQQLFTILVLMAVVTTFATPILLRSAFLRISEPEEALAATTTEV